MNQLDKINYYIKLYIENSKKDMNENESLNVHITLLKEVLSYLNEDYDIIFEKKETLNACALDGSLITNGLIPIMKDSDTLPLYYSYFAVDALVFKDIKSRSATLRNRKTGKNTTLCFDGFDYFLLWTKPNAGYICLEPWTGVPASVDAGYDITEKEGITLVMPKSEFNVTHTIYF